MFFCAVLPPKGNTMCSSLTCTLPSALLPIHALGDQRLQARLVQANILPSCFIHHLSQG